MSETKAALSYELLAIQKQNGRLVVARRPFHTLTIQGRSMAASFFSHLPPVG
jgi:hypothetical protein